MSDAAILRFGAFELHPGSGELRHHGDVVKLPPQPFKVLESLVRRGGEVVTREEIRERVWRGDTFVDFDQGLNFCIRQIREALGDNAESPQFIETLPRRGYRFVVPVESARREARGAPTRLIVLPFRMLRPDAETDFLAFSLPDALTISLVRTGIAGRALEPRGLTFRRRRAGIRERSRAEADVDVIVTGTLLRTGDGIRVSHQLTDASSGTLLWSHTAADAGRQPVSGPGRAHPAHRRLAVVAADRARTAHAPRDVPSSSGVRGLPARESAQSRCEAVECRARSVPALRRGRSRVMRRRGRASGESTT